jgi:redox-sensitive bicupin YhaK (pirin superfamily)
MSTTDAEFEVPQSPARLSAGPGTGDLALTSAREARVGDVTVRRLLPLRQRRSVGAWCFVDHYGPMSVDGVAGMRVPPHPHIGLQTVTWLISGSVLHRDSLGSEQMIRPGQLNLMTSGRGIAHSEESPAEHDPELRGVQLWVALPDAQRHVRPAFEHHAELPAFGAGGLGVTVFLGSLAGARTPATVYSEIVGAEIVARRGAADWDAADWAVTGHAAGGPDASGRIAVTPSHEHVVFVSAGSADVEGAVLRTGQLLYLGTGREQLTMAAAAGSRLFLLGGVPLGEPLLMWWNFVARTPEEITAAAGEWASGKFGTVNGYDGEPLAAPPLDTVRLTRPR